MKKANPISNTGEETTYEMKMRCTNCGWDGFINFLKGEKVDDYARCPNCETHELIRFLSGE